tara:strand:- start:60 stop:479 length:420 start_codon:yes stop_codon:yes gene_type:complete
METDCKVVKLTNGDDLVCQIFSHADGKYTIGSPYKMKVYNDVTERGVAESLHLASWVGPFTENKTFEIKESHVLLITDASSGLTSYYKNIIRRRTELKLTDELEEWDNAQYDELYDDDEDEYNKLLDAIKERIHKTLLH